MDYLRVNRRRSGAPADAAMAAGAWSSLVVGLGSLATGVLYRADNPDGRGDRVPQEGQACGPRAAITPDTGTRA